LHNNESHLTAMSATLFHSSVLWRFIVEITRQCEWKYGPNLEQYKTMWMEIWSKFGTVITMYQTETILANKQNKQVHK